MATQINLKGLMAELGLKHSALAKHIGYSTATVSLILNYDRWPKNKGGKPALKARITEYLAAAGMDQPSLSIAFNEAPPRLRANAVLAMAANAALSGPQTDGNQPEDTYMLLRKHRITSEARQHFRIPRDPFNEEMDTDEDVFITDDIRYVRAAMRQTAKHGGILAVIAESGGGKSTLRKDLHHWINNQREPITVIEPYVIGMAESDKKGKPLMAADITGALIRQVAPGTTLRVRDRAAQMHEILKGSAQIGRKHVLVIEEAHDLAIPTLKHLKRFYELEDGFKKLLAIILIGQTELDDKLSEHNPNVREVVQRCEIVRLPALDNHIEGYLRHKFSRVELDFDALIEGDAVAEIRNRLRTTVVEGRRGVRETRSISLCHPLAINNLVSAAMNEAVKIGAPKVTAGLIAAAVRAA